MHALTPKATRPASSKGLRNLNESDVDVIVLHGDFALHTAPRPSEAKVPTGSVLTIVVDAHTGEVRARQLSDDAPAATSSMSQSQMPLQ
jgi:hypothetical protein